MISDSERVADELSSVARRLHEIADDAEAGRNDVRIDPSRFHALAYYMESWSLSIDRTCEMKSIPKSSYRVCSRCGAFVRRDAVTNCTEVIPVRRCPNCGARVVSVDGD